MWVSVLRAKVKPVAGVVEVGRIRVTDQRAPREPVPGKSRLRRGPWVSSRARIASKTRARCTRLSACLFSFLRSFSSFLRSFLSVSLSRSLDHLESSFSSLEHLYPSPFVIVLPFPSLRTILCLSCLHSFSSSSVAHPLRFLPHSALSSFLVSLPPLLNSFSLFSSHSTVRFSR